MASTDYIVRPYVRFAQHTLQCSPVLDILDAVGGERVDLQVVGYHQDVLHRLRAQA